MPFGSSSIFRASVFKTQTDTERRHQTLYAMHRLVTNIPSNARGIDVQALLSEGHRCNFGRFLDCFCDGMIESDRMLRFASPTQQKFTDPLALNSQYSPIDRNGEFDAAPESDIELTHVREDSDEDYDDASQSARGSSLDASVSTSKYSDFSTEDLHDISFSSQQNETQSHLIPERQHSKWDGDLYRPFWTRGFGKNKEGWCGICEPGQWLKTKTSVYWLVGGFDLTPSPGITCTTTTASHRSLATFFIRLWSSGSLLCNYEKASATSAISGYSFKATRR